MTQSKGQGTITSDSTRNPRFGFQASILTSSSNLSISFTDLLSLYFSKRRRHDGRDAPKDHPLEQICGLSKCAICMSLNHWYAFLVPPDGFPTSPSFQYCVQCSGLLADVDARTRVPQLVRPTFMIDKASAAFRNCVPNSRSPKRFSEVATAVSSCPALRNPGVHCRPKPPFLLCGFFLADTRSESSCPRPLFLRTDEVQLVELYQFARPQACLQSQKEGDCHNPVPLPCEFVRHGRPGWQRTGSARLRWALAPPPTQAFPRSCVGLRPVLENL